MERLLYQQLMRNDKLYVHLSGQVRDMTIQKSLPAFGTVFFSSLSTSHTLSHLHIGLKGFTISDSSAGAVVKRLHAGGLAELERFIFPGEVLAAIDGAHYSLLHYSPLSLSLLVCTAYD